jgi:hypothetical protein
MGLFLLVVLSPTSVATAAREAPRIVYAGRCSPCRSPVSGSVDRLTLVPFLMLPLLAF